MLAHEFIKLRFGIFDEVGFPGDYLYPATFLMAGEIYPTGVSNTQVEGNWVLSDGRTHCQPDNKTSSCVYRARAGSNPGVSCSLGSYAHLPHVDKYCSPDEIRGPSGPTKQLVLCEGKFAWEIISASEDFTKTDPRAEGRAASPRIDFVREAAPSHVLVLEVSASMELNDDWKYINKAAHKLIRYDLSDSARLGVVTFSGEARLEAGLTRVGEARDHLADIIPDKYRLAEDDGRCVVCGLNMAVNQVLGDNKAGGHIVLVTRAGPDTLSITDQEIILEYVEYYQIQISVMMVPGHNQPYLPFYDEISGQSGGRAHLVQQDTPVKKYWAMLEALTDICGTAAATVYSRVETISDLQTESAGSFLVPASHGHQTLFGIIVEDEEDHLIDQIVFENEDGLRFGPYSHIATTFDNINMKTVSFGLRATQPFQDWSHVSQEWKYWIQWHRPGPVTREAVVIVSSSPDRADSASPEVKVKMWTSQSSLTAGLQPMELFVSVSAGGCPVVGARVEISVEVTTTDLTEYHNLPPFHLADTGTAQPDMTAGDGVYSGELRDFPAPGRYVFTVSVETDNTTRLVREEEEEEEEGEVGVMCCGSQTNVMSSQLTGLAPVRLQSVGLVVTVVTVPDPLSPATPAPPHRVSDLSVQPGLTEDSLEASWTPPAHQGAASGYRLVTSPDISELLQPRPDLREATSVLLTGLRLQQTPDGRVSFTFAPEQPGDFYLGVLGLSQANTPGKISNLVYVSSPQSPPGLVGDAFSSEADLEGGSSNSSQSVIVLSVCGSLLLIVLSLSAGVLVFLRSRRKKAAVVRRERVVVSAGLGPGQDDTTDNTSCSSTTHNNSGNNLMPDVTSHIQTISRPQYFFSSLPPESTPTYWSATTLLTEHEQRALAMSYCSSGPGPAVTSLYSESLYYPDDDSLSISSNSKQAESVKEGITNPVFPQHQQYHGTPVHGLLSHRGQFSPCDEMSEAEAELGSQDGSQAPVRFSTGVQTIAPSAIATLRQNNTYLASLRNRNVSLV